MARLHLFDMDGTLLHGSSANRELALQLGLVEEFRRLDEEFVTGLVDSAGYARRAFVLLRDLTERHVATAFAKPGMEVFAFVRGTALPCTVTALPFTPHRYKKG